MRRLALLLAAAMLVVSNLSAGADPEIGDGSVLYWSSNSGGMAELYQDMVLHRGEDFILYRNMEFDGDLGAGNYYVEFSGLLYMGCEDAMPSAQERASLMEMWPLATGATLRIEDSSVAEFTIGEPTQYFLMGRYWPAHLVEVGYEESTETLIVADGLKAPVRIDWDEASRDSLLLVTAPRERADAADLNSLDMGTCAALLN